LAHFLDNNPTGQWIRKKYLNIEQELLSLELLYDLSKKSLEINQPPDRSDAWIARVLDETAKNATLRRDISFIVGGSGLGKSVACYRLLTEHVKQNGVGLIIPHEIISSAINLEQAIIAALCQLHANLSTIGLSPLSFCSSQNPLLLVVDDINRSGQAQLLAEKLLRWFAGNSEQKGLSRYRIVCPLWPEVLLSLGDQARKLIEPWSDVA
jgi:type II secretory pathway predicted ATPase ExeA